MSAQSHYDVIIIGSGAGGGTLAHRLAASGKRILILERGGWLPREPENWDSREVFGRHRYASTESWRDRDGKSFAPETHYVVGGNTKVYGAALFRLRESDFAETAHADGISPAWPLSYADFAPYYLQAEQLYQVHGTRGSDPTEPPDPSPYPFPALAHEPAIAELDEQLRGAGCRPFPLPMALRVDATRPENSACIRCPTCDGFPCLVQGKSDAEITCIRPLLQEHSANVELMIDAQVLRIDTDERGGRVKSVQVLVGGEQIVLSADLFVLAAGSINSAALLLRSRSAQHPNGLANGSGVVGRHYMCHVSSAFMMLKATRNPTRFQKTLGLNDWYHASADGKRPALGHVQMLGKVDGGILAAQAPGFMPLALLDSVGHRTVDFWLMSEDLPMLDNRVEIDDDGVLRLSYRANNLAAHQRLDADFRALLTRAQSGSRKSFMPDRAYLSRRIPLSGVAHQCGTVRFGTDPATSALNLDCRAHELDNLYVVDGSFFPSAGAVNPTLTIIANALRVGDVIRRRLA